MELAGIMELSDELDGANDTKNGWKNPTEKIEKIMDCR